MEITYRGFVYSWDCNHMGHASVVTIARMFDEATWSVMADVGLTRAAMCEGNFKVATVASQTQYFAELLAGDTVTVRSTVCKVGQTSFGILSELAKDSGGGAAARQEITQVLLDGQTGRSTSVDRFRAAMISMGSQT